MLNPENVKLVLAFSAGQKTLTGQQYQALKRLIRMKGHPINVNPDNPAFGLRGYEYAPGTFIAIKESILDLPSSPVIIETFGLTSLDLVINNSDS